MAPRTRQAKKTAPVPARVEDLDFDPKNPRLTGSFLTDRADDRAVIKYMLDHYDLEELLRSISSTGFINFEPLIVIPSDQHPGRFIVLEGNRRLAALRLLRQPELAAELGKRLPAMTAEVLATLHEVSVFEVASREEARAFIGFKHVNGPQRWDSYAKARYAADWYSQEQAKKSGLSLDDIAEQMGDTNETIPRMVSALFVLDQARDKRVFSIKDKTQKGPFAFSHFYTALGYPVVRDFLGLPEEWRADVPSTNAVPAKNLDELGELLVWLYGSKAQAVPPVIRTQNPDLRNLVAVIGAPKALSVLRAKRDLPAAYERVDGGTSRFEKSLVDAFDYAEKAAGSVSAYDGGASFLSIASSLKDTAAGLHEQMMAMSKRAAKERKG